MCILIFDSCQGAMKSTYILQQRCEILQETLGMRATYMEELEFLRMLPLHLMSHSWRPWLSQMLALVLLLVKVKFEVKLLILKMMMVVFDCLVDYLLFCFSFKLVSCILTYEHYGMF